MNEQWTSANSKTCLVDATAENFFATDDLEERERYAAICTECVAEFNFRDE